MAKLAKSARPEEYDADTLDYLAEWHTATRADENEFITRECYEDMQVLMKAITLPRPSHTPLLLDVPSLPYVGWATTLFVFPSPSLSLLWHLSPYCCVGCIIT